MACRECSYPSTGSPPPSLSHSVSDRGFPLALEVDTALLDEQFWGWTTVVDALSDVLRPARAHGS